MNTAVGRQRLYYMDVIKGIAIFIVVMGHVLTMCVRDIDRAVVFKFIGEIHMPLFFFISGWFTYKLTDDGRWLTPNLAGRFRQLIIPMVVVSSLWIFYFPHSGLESPLNSTFEGLWTDGYKNGYWFTLVLFEIMVIYALLTPILSRLTNMPARIMTVCALWALMLVMNQTVTAEVGGYCSLELMTRFFPVFMFGVLASSSKDNFNRLTTSQAVITSSILIGGVLLYMICWPWDIDGLTDYPIVINILRTLFHITISMIAIALTRPWCNRVFSSGRPCFMARVWTYLGAQSLAIYLLHYFFLFPLGATREALREMALGWTPTFVFAAVVAACIVTMVSGLIYIIKSSNLLSALLIGQTNHPKSKLNKSMFGFKPN